MTLLLGVALVVLPVLVLVLALPVWEQRVVDADDAARAGVRVLATAQDWPDGVSAAELAVGRVALSDGLPLGDVIAAFSGSLVPSGSVSASVTVAIPVGGLPGLGALGTVHYTAVCIAHVDSYADSPS